MADYKQASRLNLMFNTTKGLLTLGQVWSLSLIQLKTAITAQHDLIKQSSGGTDDELSFLGEDTPKVDPIDQLRFDILKDIYTTKKSEADAVKNEKDIKEHNQKIMALIAEKEDEELKGKSAEELRAMLKK